MMQIQQMPFWRAVGRAEVWRPAALAALAAALAVAPATVPAQETLDRIVAVIGDDVILQSDVDNQYAFLRANGQPDKGTLRCEVLEDLLVSKLLLNKARQDSITVGEGEVTGEIERRVAYFLQQMGQEEFEKVYRKSVAEFKADMRPEVEEALLVQRQRATVTDKAQVTPREVKAFYKTIPKDSLGLLPAEVELNQIVIVPPFDPSSKEAARAELVALRTRLVGKQEDFAALASKYSEDPGSRKKGGDLGEFSPGMMVKEFDEVVYSLREGEVSEVFETEYGYHVVKLEQRKGQIVRARHILRIPQRNAKGDSIAIARLTEIRNNILADSFSFEAAAIRYSEDRASKDCGGCIANPETGELRIPMDKLDSELFFKVDEMKAGEISMPSEYVQLNGSRAFHILYLRKKLPPHAPNLNDDYKKIQASALQAKQAQYFDTWLMDAKKNIYIDLRPTECSNALSRWLK